jgi:hypothetical protein
MSGLDLASMTTRQCNSALLCFRSCLMDCRVKPGNDRQESERISLLLRSIDRVRRCAPPANDEIQTRVIGPVLQRRGPRLLPFFLFPTKGEWSAGSRQRLARPLMGGSLAIGPPARRFSRAGLRSLLPGARTPCDRGATLSRTKSWIFSCRTAAGAPYPGWERSRMRGVAAPGFLRSSGHRVAPRFVRPGTAHHARNRCIVASLECIVLAADTKLQQRDCQRHEAPIVNVL